MLNTETHVNNKINQNFNYNINAVSGTIRKSHPKSIITKVKLDDTLLDKINPRYITTKRVESSFGMDAYYNQNIDNPVIILQVMLCGDNQCLVEFVLEEEFNKDNQFGEQNERT